MTSKNMTPEQRERSNALQRERRKANAERTKEQKRRYYLKHQEKNLAYAADYRKKNPDKVRDREKARDSEARYRASNPERERARCQAWKNANKERRAETNRVWRSNNGEKVRAYQHNRRSRVRNVQGQLSPGLAEKLLFLQKGKCACCGKSLDGGYEMDHIIPVSKGGKNIDSNIQLLTKHCNRSKGAKDPVAFMQLRGKLI